MNKIATIGMDNPAIREQIERLSAATGVSAVRIGSEIKLAAARLAPKEPINIDEVKKMIIEKAQRSGQYPNNRRGRRQCARDLRKRKI